MTSSSLFAVSWLGIPVGENAIAPEIDIVDNTYRTATSRPSEDKMDYGIPSKPDVTSPVAIFESPEETEQRLATEELAEKQAREAAQATVENTETTEK